MHEFLDHKFVVVTPPGAIVDNAAFTTSTIDSDGYDNLDIVVLFGAMDIAMAVLKLQQSDDSGMSGAADVTNGNFATGSNAAGTAQALPSASADNTAFHIHVDLKGKKRYFDLSATGGDGSAGTYMVVLAFLSRGDKTPSSMAQRGYAGELFC